MHDSFVAKEYKINFAPEDSAGMLRTAADYIKVS